jgi:Leucine-rich repeat (LRR) protein
LDLSYNKLVTLYRNVFYGLNRLTTLNLKGNYLLETLEAGTFLSLTNVKGLDIVGTKMFRLKPAAMPIMHRNMRNISFVIKSEHEENASFFGSQFSSLTNKGLIQQNIYESVNSSFNLLRVVKGLDIVGTKIFRLKPDTFKGLDQLQYLNISRNKITIVDKDCFSGLTNLIDLDLPINAAMPIIHRNMRNISFVIKSEHEENASCFGSQFSSLTNKGLKQQNLYESVNSFFKLLRVVNISKSFTCKCERLRNCWNQDIQT